MMLFLFLSIISTSMALTGCPGSQYCAYFELFEDPNRIGWTQIHDRSVSGLEDFDDIASSFCVHRGIAILYTETSWNTESESGSSLWAYTNAYVCFNIESYFDNKISSIRLLQTQLWSQQDHYNHIIFFTREGFMGDMEIKIDQDKDVLESKQGSSTIVIGKYPWTLYDQPKFQGAAACIYPKGNGVPGFYPYKSDLGHFGGNVASIKKGCHVEQGQIVDKPKETNQIKYLTGFYRGS